MAIDKDSSSRELTGVDDAVDATVDPSIEDGCERGELTHPVIRIKPTSRPRSFLHILEGFQEEGPHVTPSPSTSNFSAQTDDSADVALSSVHPNLLPSDDSSTLPVTSFETAPTSLPPSSGPRIEDTSRRRQRFSLPIVGLQTTSVTARANAKGEGLAKRFSLVLGGGRTIRASRSTRVHLDQGAGEGTVKQSGSTGHGVAASKLAELLGRRKGA
jgi:FYVE/RhoGEF/PH domain-containing protein 5/6